MATAQAIYDHFSNPVDIVEQIATIHDWTFERSTPDELTLTVSGTWCEYHISLTWREDLEALHLACAFDFKVSKLRLGDIYKLMALINEQLWLGHFDIWSRGGVLLYRHGLMLGEDGLLGISMAQTAVEAAVSECDRFYPAFQFVLWGDKSPREALDAAMFETSGEA